MRLADSIFVFTFMLFVFWVGSVLKGQAKRIYIACWIFIVGLLCLGSGVRRMRQQDISYRPERRGGVGSAQEVLAGLVFIIGGLYYLRISKQKNEPNQPSETTRGKGT